MIMKYVIMIDEIKLNIFEQESEVIIQIQTFISLKINHFIKSNYSNPSNKIKRINDSKIRIFIRQLQSK